MMKVKYDYKSPVGWLEIIASDAALISIRFISKPKSFKKKINHPVIKNAIQDLDAFFNGQDPRKTSILGMNGTNFQQKVWSAARQIPRGKTWSYKDLAKFIRRPRASRACGQALRNNPIMILIPCHRVIQTSGGLGGYAGGLDKKKALLSFEKKV